MGWRWVMGAVTKQRQRQKTKTRKKKKTKKKQNSETQKAKDPPPPHPAHPAPIILPVNSSINAFAIRKSVLQAPVFDQHGYLTKALFLSLSDQKHEVVGSRSTFHLGCR